MLQSYKTIKSAGKSEIVVEKSRFIAYIARSQTIDEALAFIASIKSKHPDASHHCSAYLIGEHDQYQKANDDGEPSGTAGKPILEVLKKLELKNTVAVITRYFGGTKLGAGGLIRAYGQATKEGIISTGIVECTLHRQLVVNADYTWHGKLQHLMAQLGISIADTTFTDQVTLTLLVPEEQEEQMRGTIANATNGQAHMEAGQLVYEEKEIK